MSLQSCKTCRYCLYLTEAEIDRMGEKWQSHGLKKCSPLACLAQWGKVAQ
jgi:hypothetical protein